MKKLLYLFSAVALMLTSCSSSDDSSSSYILVTQIIQTNEFAGNIETNTINFNYNGNRLISQSIGNAIVEFTYTGDLITKIEYKQGNEVFQRTEYTYDTSARLINYKRYEYSDSEDYGVDVNYVYNTNGTINYIKNSGYLPNLSFSSSGTFTMNQEGLVSTIASSNGDFYTYSYDSKNNPFKNILGVNKLPFEDDEANSFYRNYISIAKSNSGFPNNTNYNHIYNSNNYPTQTIEDDSFETVTSQYSYNQ